MLTNVLMKVIHQVKQNRSSDLKDVTVGDYDMVLKPLNIYKHKENLFIYEIYELQQLCNTRNDYLIIITHSLNLKPSLIIQGKHNQTMLKRS